jgi:hypothetical protein
MPATRWAAQKAAHSSAARRRKKRRSTRTRGVAGSRRKQKGPGKPGLKCSLVRLRATLYKLTEYPVGESNPCLRRERALSWATRRTGRAVVAPRIQDFSALGGERLGAWTWANRPGAPEPAWASASGLHRGLLQAMQTPRLAPAAASAHDVIPCVSFMNAVSRLISSSASRVRAWPLAMRSFASSLGSWSPGVSVTRRWESTDSIFSTDAAC